MISIFSALVINMLILGFSSSFLYLSNQEMWITGTGDLRILYLVIAIPPITWLNAFVLLFMKVEEIAN